MIEILVPIVVMTGMFAMIFGIVYVRSRENMAMIEKGLNPRQKNNRPCPFVNLKYGLLMIGAGLGLLISYILDAVFFHHNMVTTKVSDSNETYTVDIGALYCALVSIGGGIGLFLSYRIEKKEWLDKKMED